MSTVSVIIPAYNAAHTLPQMLARLCAAVPPPFEIIAVNDGSTDETASEAESFGIRVLPIAQNTGAAAAKNQGAHAARGEILLFLDSDVVPPEDVIARLLAVFERRNCEGVVGLLDESIPLSNWASQFKNLWMNFTYARLNENRPIGLFYTSVAAMRRTTFLELGGFDVKYHGASIAEDTEFGQRAWARGVLIFPAPTLRVVHLKTYTSQGVLREDFKRAYALTLMRLRKWGEPFFTSVPTFYQLAVPTVYITLFLLVLGLLTQNMLALTTALVGLIAFYALNIPLLTFFLRLRGGWFTFLAILFLPLDVFIVGLGMLAAVINFVRGIRY